MRKLILLDRDGTVNEEVHYLASPEQLKLIPGAAEGIRRLNQSGFSVVIITNQSGVGRGYLSLATLDSIHQRLRELLAAEGATVDGIFYCPHLPGDNCPCRKPQAQMAHEAAAALNLSLDGAVVIGDKACDILLGKAIKATSLLVRTGHGSQYSIIPGSEPDMIFSNLRDAAEWVSSDMR